MNKCTFAPKKEQNELSFATNSLIFNPFLPFFHIPTRIQKGINEQGSNEELK